MLPLLTAANEEVRQGAAAAMKNVVHQCLGGSELGGQQVQAVEQLEAGLGAMHQEAWPAVLSGEMNSKRLQLVGLGASEMLICGKIKILMFLEGL